MTSQHYSEAIYNDGVIPHKKTMERIKVRRRVGQDGILHLDSRVGIIERDVEVRIVYRVFHRQWSLGDR